MLWVDCGHAQRLTRDLEAAVTSPRRRDAFALAGPAAASGYCRRRAAEGRRDRSCPLTCATTPV